MSLIQSVPGRWFAVSRRYFLPVLSLGISAVCLLSAGCGGGVPKANSAKKETAAAKSDTSLDSRTRCEDFLKNVIGQYQPLTVDLVADRVVSLQQLNDWRKSCADEPLEAPAIPARLADAVTGGNSDFLGSPRYREGDAEHLRDAMLLRDVARHVGETAGNERERILKVFRYVVQAVALEGQSAVPPVLPPYDRLVLGSGTAADRAAIFIEILRQMRFDAVVLWLPQEQRSQTAKTSASDKGTPGAKEEFNPHQPMLVGVLTEAGVLLFEPGLGQPVWKATESIGTKTDAKPGAKPAAATSAAEESPAPESKSESKPESKPEPAPKSDSPKDESPKDDAPATDSKPEEGKTEPEQPPDSDASSKAEQETPPTKSDTEKPEPPKSESDPGNETPAKAGSKTTEPKSDSEEQPGKSDTPVPTESKTPADAKPAPAGTTKGPVIGRHPKSLSADQIATWAELRTSPG